MKAGSPVKAYRVRVRGRVQRVGYRGFLLDLAQDMGLAGFVENRRDGSVLVFVQGSEGSVRDFLDLAKSPPRGIVRGVDVEEVEAEPGLEYFEIKFGSVQEELQEGFGAMETEFRDYREEFRDYRSEFRSFVGEFRDYREEFRDYRKEFRDYREEFRDYRGEFKSFVGEFRDYREEFRDFARRTDENFRVILEKYGEISQGLKEILETLVRESRETRERLSQALEMLADAINLLRKS